MDTVRKVIVAVIVTAVLPFAVVAQTWQTRSNDSGALITASVSAPERSLSFFCTTPSPTGLPLLQTNEHESHRTDTPFTIIFAVGDALLDPYTDSSDLNATRVTFDTTTYGVPTMPWDEFFWSWNTTLSMQDPMVLNALSVRDMVFDPGRGTAYRYPVDGLSDGLRRTMATCVAGWQRSGVAVPPALQPFLSSDSTEPLPEPPTTVSPALDAHIRAGCNSSYQLSPSTLGLADLDRDGVEDVVLDWADVNCLGQLRRPFCGAANCSIDVFLSTRPGRPAGEFLGVGYQIVPAPNGGLGLRFGGTAAVCAQGGCDLVFWWDGQQFRQ